jgi:hypothetical protein
MNLIFMARLAVSRKRTYTRYFSETEQFASPVNLCRSNLVDEKQRMPPRTIYDKSIRVAHPNQHIMQSREKAITSG